MSGSESEVVSSSISSSLSETDLLVLQTSSSLSETDLLVLQTSKNQITEVNSDLSDVIGGTTAY